MQKDEKSDFLNLKGKKIVLYQRGTGFRYSGLVLDESNCFLIIDDEFSGRTRILHKEEIASIEVQTSS